MRKLQSKRNLKQLNLSQASEALSPWPGLLCPFSASLNLRDSFILELDFYLQDSSHYFTQSTLGFCIDSLYTIVQANRKHLISQMENFQIKFRNIHFAFYQLDHIPNNPKMPAAFKLPLIPTVKGILKITQLIRNSYYFNLFKHHNLKFAFFVCVFPRRAQCYSSAHN